MTKNSRISQNHAKIGDKRKKEGGYQTEQYLPILRDVLKLLHFNNVMDISRPLLGQCTVSILGFPAVQLRLDLLLQKIKA